MSHTYSYGHDKQVRMLAYLAYQRGLLDSEDTFDQWWLNEGNEIGNTFTTRWNRLDEEDE